MAVQWVHRVFEHSALIRTQYLFMIILADDADNDGVSVISAQALANRIRTKVNPATGERNTRTVFRAVNAAELAGEIFVQKAAGVENVYLICLNRTKEEIIEALIRRLGLDAYTADMVAQERVESQKRTRDKMPLVTRDKMSWDPGQNVTGTRDKMSLVPAVDKHKNGSLPIKDQIINIRESEEYAEMLAAVMEVCRFLDILAIAEADRERIEILVNNGVTPAEVRKHYSPNAGSWWRSYWKGKKGQRPTPKDIVETIVQAREGAEFADAEAEFTAAWKQVQDYLKGRKEWNDLSPRVQGLIRYYKESILRQASKAQMAKFRQDALGVWGKSSKEVDRT